MLLVLALLVAGTAAAYRLDLGARWLGLDDDAPSDRQGGAPPGQDSGRPSAPPPVELPVPSPAPPVAWPEADTTALDPARVAGAVGPLLGARALGRRVLAAVAPLDDGPTVFRLGSGPFIPASTMKLMTATAALAALGPEATFRTTVVAGRTDRDIVLVGGGDPYLARRPLPRAERALAHPPPADVVTLARRTAAELRSRGVVRVRLGYDVSRFAGPSVNPTWKPEYVSGQVVSPITALWVDRGEDPDGFGRVPDPAAEAADAFADALERAGIRVRPSPRPARAAEEGEELAAVEGAPLEQVVRRVLAVSDNEAAEVLLRHVGAAVLGEASTAAGAAGARQVLAGLGVPLASVVVADGSGLSRSNRLTADSLLAVLRLAAAPEHPELRPVLEGLPVAGFSGSLSDRFTAGNPAGPGRVRAKTGTLDGVSGLAGVVTGLDGSTMAFVVALDRVRLTATLDARAALDRVAAALAGCRCGPAA